MSAAATDKLQKVGVATATTLDAPGYTVGGTSVTVVSTTNWPTTTGITFAMDEIDANGDQVAGSYNEYVGVVASATSITNVSHASGTGTDQNYSAGTTTRVYMPVSAERENRIVDWGLVEHGQLGTHTAITATSITTSGAVLTTPKVITSINDTNANELFKVTATASAVNELTVANAATGNGPTLSATGGDTNVDINLTPKGTGLVKIGGNPILTRLGINKKNTTGTVITTSYVAYLTLTATSTGKECEVQFQGIANNGNSGADQLALFKVQCDTVDITPIDLTTFLHAVPGQTPGKTMSFTVSSTPAAGSHTWTVMAKAGNATAVTLEQAVMRVTEVV